MRQRSALHAAPLELLHELVVHLQEDLVGDGRSSRGQARLEERAERDRELKPKRQDGTLRGQEGRGRSKPGPLRTEGSDLERPLPRSHTPASPARDITLPTARGP